MPHILAEFDKCKSNEMVKLCPHCLNEVVYTMYEVRCEVNRALDLHRNFVGYNEYEYIKCPLCNTRIILRSISTEHM